MSLATPEIAARSPAGRARPQKKTRTRRVFLTEEFVAGVPLVERGERAVYDKALNGFYLRIGLKEKRYEARAQYRSGGRLKSVRVKIARAGEVTAEEARRRAEVAIKNILATGRADAGNAAPGSMLVRETWESMLRDLAKRELSPNTITAYKYDFEHYLATIHDRQIEKLTRLDAVALHEGLTKRNGPYAANSALRLARSIWNFAREGLELPNMPGLNPFRASRHNALYNPETTRADRALTPAELPQWRKEVAALSNPLRKAFHVWCLLSGMRRTTVCEMQWKHIDFKQRQLLVPNPKGGEPLYLPLSRQLLLCLRFARGTGHRLHPAQARKWVWPSESHSGHIQEVKELRVTRTGHALRATYAGFAELHAGSLVVRKTLLGHVTGREIGERSYINRKALSVECRAAQDRISTAIEEALKG